MLLRICSCFVFRWLWRFSGVSGGCLFSGRCRNVCRTDLHQICSNRVAIAFAGFQIFATLTPENPQSYQLVYTTSIYGRSTVLGGFTPGLTYSFAMLVYSSYGVIGPLSNNIPVTVFGTASENGTVTSTTGQVLV